MSLYLQILKKEISKSRLKLLEPLLKGPAGLEYLKKSFSSRHGSPDQASPSLPLTKRWLLSVRGEAEREWKEHKDALSALTNNHSGSTGLPSTTMRTGGNISSVSKVNTPSSPFPGLVSIYQLSYLYGIIFVRTWLSEHKPTGRIHL